VKKEKTNDLDKYSITYEDETSISIWKYDKKKSSTGPVEVEYQYLRVYTPPSIKKKTLGELTKQTKKKKSSD
jgi:hypothetical protein